MRREPEDKDGAAKTLGIPDALLSPYRMLGDRIVRVLPLFEDLGESLEKARLKVAFPAYVAFILFYSVTAGAVAFALTFLLSFLVFHAQMVWAILLSLAFALLGGAAVLIFLYVYPSNLAGSRRRLLEEELPYTASHMAVLSQAGLTPERMFRSLASIEARGFMSVAAEEAKDIVRDVHLLGFDVVSAMERCSKRSPSNAFSEFIDGMIGVTRSGGDLTKYFLNSAKGFMDHARIAARQLVETLGTLAEAYVSMMVVFPLIAIVMLAVMGVIGGTLGGVSILFAMYIIAYVLLPVFAIMLLLLLDSIMPPR
ncbi:MAG: type II secretion system F family protein [Candidatus Bathyarchaeia archaeon]